MLNLKNEKYFLIFLNECKNDRQVKEILKNISSNQYTLLKNLTQDILEGEISLTGKQYKKLLLKKKFIRTFCTQKISKNILSRNYKVILDIIDIVLNQNEACTKSSISTGRRMGKSKKQKHERYQKNRNRNSNTETAQCKNNRKSDWRRKNNEDSSSEEEEEEQQQDQEGKESEEISSEEESYYSNSTEEEEESGEEESKSD